MLECDGTHRFCNNCSHDWRPGARLPRFRSLDDLVARGGLRRDEVVTLADIGALNAFGYDRRSALWQAERAVRPSGELFTTINAEPAEHAENGGLLRFLRVLRLTSCPNATWRGSYGN